MTLDNFSEEEVSNDVVRFISEYIIFHIKEKEFLKLDIVDKYMRIGAICCGRPVLIYDDVNLLWNIFEYNVSKLDWVPRFSTQLLYVGI